MSTAPASPPGAPASTDQPPAQPAQRSTEACPLCRSPLHPEQEWCLSCGAAARTRLAASPAWKAPIVAIVVVLVLSLGVLAGSLVKLASGSSPAATQTTTITTQAAATTTATQAQLPATTATTTTTPRGALPGTTTQGSTSTPGTGAKPSPKTLSPQQLNNIKTNIPGLKKAVEERLRKLGLLPHAKK